ncbi:MAG: prolipoprotein diacylglyceryl transferase [Ruminococcaceae bacterium]|nr:prolipoprotein diacylglyceryl transferase [Oscillospiraceae bacterium]
MADYTMVYFKGLEKGISVPSVLAQFEIPFLGEMSIKWYGAIIAFGFLLAVLFGGRQAWKWRMSIDKMLDVLIFGTVGGILGARLYYVAFEWDYYAHHLDEIFKIWHGGLAIYGGIIGGLLAAYITCKVNKLNFYNLLDMAGMSLLIGQGIGRWGNFMNQEAFGINTDLPWGMRSEKTMDYILSNQELFAEKGITMNPGGYVHPTFLYESLWCLVGFAILYVILRKFRRFSGQIFLCYGIWYGIGRAIFEGLRTDSLYIGDTTIRVSQLLSAVVVVAFAAVLVALLVKFIKHPKPIEGVDFFPEGSRIPKSERVPQEFTLETEVENDGSDN